MNPWLRLALLLGALVMCALLLKILPPLVVLALFVGGVAGTNYVLRARQRGEPERATAHVLGLERLEADRSGVLGLPFVLLGRARAPIVRDAMRGPWGGTDVTVFDLVLTSSGGPEPVAERTSTCAVASARFAGPHLVVEPRALLLPPIDLPEVAIGSERFREAFDVRCRDQTFARSFLDADRIDWLLAQQERWGFELDGSLLLLYGERVPVADRVEILDALVAFLERLPPPSDAPPSPMPPRPDAPAG